MKTLTTIIYVLGLLLSTLFVSAQSKADKIYDSFANTDGVASFTFTKNMVDAINLDFGDNGEAKKVSGDLNEIRFLSYNPEEGNLSGEAFLKKAVSMLPSQYKKYEDDDSDGNTEIWLLGKKRKYSECHVFIHNENVSGNQFLVSFYGSFNVNDLEGLKAAGEGMSN
ncbi:MAG: DUF4252 domain-containing protein [Draconibacterium sp.]